jgi:L-aspartate oxidase
MDREYVDFLIIGGGIAGLRAAVELAPHGSVLVLTKDLPSESSSEYAQGGIAVALSDEDEVHIHYEDTIKAGDGLCNEEAVRILVEEGPPRIQELISWGAEFDKDGTRLAFALEAAHSRKRVLRAQGDSTGRELMRVLVSKVRSYASVRRYPYALVTDLILSDGKCVGAYVLKERNLMAVLAKATVLATGGGGQIYSVTTNPQVATADGMAMARRAGAALRDVEFVQFHPTSLYLPDAPHFLLSEAMRGEGARLRNIRKELFMERYHPRAELASRDVVSRAIVSEMVRTGSEHVYLDLTHLDGEFVKKRFPNIYSTCLGYEVDVANDLVPVCPAAHYMMGGVETDTSGSTNVPGLFAAGETARTGIHGANRLASNSLLEGIVYGARAGSVAFKRQVEIGEPELKWPSAVHTIAAHDEIRSALRRLMWEKVGIIRCEVSLKEAVEKLGGWAYILNRNFITRRELELKNMLQVAMLVTEAALKRKKSVGAHFRSDYKED